MKYDIKIDEVGRADPPDHILLQPDHARNQRSDRTDLSFDLGDG